MKKVIIIILCMIFTVNLVACSTQSNKFTVVEVSGYDTYSVASRHNDVSLNIENYEKLFKLDKSVTINGNTFVGEYTRSAKAYFYNADVDYYEYADDGVRVDFGINSNTNVVVSYSYVDFNYTTKKGNAPVLTENECFDIALEYLEQYIDADEYSMISSNYSEIPEYNAIYDFEFVRLVDNVETSDNVYIGVSIFGDVISHLFGGTINEMNNVPDLSAEDYKTIESNIDTKIKSIFDTVKNEYDYSYACDEKRLIKLSDGAFAMEYYISVNLKPKNPAAIDKSETVKLLVYLE